MKDESRLQGAKEARRRAMKANKRQPVKSTYHPDIPVPMPSPVQTGNFFTPDRPTYTGWTFLDWFKDPEGTNIFNRLGEVVRGDIDLWGKWSQGTPADSHKINFRWDDNNRIRFAWE